MAQVGIWIGLFTQAALRSLRRSSADGNSLAVVRQCRLVRVLLGQQHPRFFFLQFKRGLQFGDLPLQRLPAPFDLAAAPGDLLAVS